MLNGNTVATLTFNQLQSRNQEISAFNQQESMIGTSRTRSHAISTAGSS